MLLFFGIPILPKMSIIFFALVLSEISCLFIFATAQEVEINIEDNPYLRQVIRVNDTINALNASPAPNSPNSTAVNNTTTTANTTVSGNLTTSNTTTTLNGTASNSTTSSNSSAIVVPPDSSSVNSTISTTNDTLPAQNSSLLSSNTTVGANLTTSSNTTNNNSTTVNGTSSFANTTTTVITTNTTGSNLTTNGTSSNGTSTTTIASSNTTSISSNETSGNATVNGTATNSTGLNSTNTTTLPSGSASSNTTVNGTATSSTNVTINNSTIPVISASTATNRSADGTVTLPSVFILEAVSTTPTTTATTTATTVPLSVVTTTIPATTTAGLTTATVPTTVTPVSTTDGPTASSVLVTPSIRNDSTRPSIVVNIDIDLGTPPTTPTSTIVTTPTAMSTTTLTTLLPSTTISGQITVNSANTTQSPNSPLTPTTAPTVTTGSPVGIPTTTVPTVSRPTLEELVANRNGTQVVCFSLPFDLLEKLLPLISSLGISPNSVTTPSPGSSSPLYNPLTSALTQSPPTVPGVSTVTATTTPTGNHPFLGPFGSGSYGGFRPTVPPQPTYATTQTTTTSRPMNPYPVMPPQQVMQPAGVIPYYTYAPGAGSNYANMQPAGGYGGPSVSIPAYPVSYDKPGGSYGGSFAQPPAQAVISTINVAPPQPGSPKDAAVLESKALTNGPPTAPLSRQQIVTDLPAWCANKNLVPDAITVTGDGLTHVFIGNQVLSVKNSSTVEKKVVQNSIQKIWRGLMPDVTRITGATTRPDGTTYLFSGPSYWKFDTLYRMARDSPRKTSIGFPGVAQMDSVYQDFLSDGDMSFLQGPGYFTYNHKKFPPYQGPASLTELGLPSEVTKVDAAFTDPTTKDLVFVVGTAMYRVSPSNNGSSRIYKVLPGYPKPFRTLLGCPDL